MSIYCCTLIVVDPETGDRTVRSRMSTDLSVCRSWALSILYASGEARRLGRSDIEIWDEASAVGTYSLFVEQNTLVITKAQLHTTVTF